MPTLTPCSMLAHALLLTSTLTAAAAHAGPTTYFLVAEWPGETVHGDSFVLPLSDTDHVTHARDLIDRGPADAGASIVFATIRYGADGGVNRDVLAPERPAWSWHVSDFDGFGDFGIELVDGWPTFVEGDVTGWFRNTGGLTDDDVDRIPDEGRIGFWSYTVVAELHGYDPRTGSYDDSPAVIPLPAATPAAAVVGLAALAGHAVRRRRAAH